jgi:rhamnosyltransferase subunit B
MNCRWPVFDLKRAGKLVKVPGNKELTILIVAQGSGGDVYPNVRLGRELKRRGHRVVLVTNELFGKKASREADIEFIQLGTAQEAEKVMSDPDLWKRGRGYRVFSGYIMSQIEETYRIISDQYVTGRTVVMAPLTAFGARMAYEKLGVPLATVVLQPLLLRSLNVQPGVSTPDWFRPVLRSMRRALLPALDRLVFDPVLAPRINDFRRKLGLAPIERVLNRWAYSPELVIGLFPDWFAPVQEDWPVNTRLTGFPLTKEHPAPLTPELEQFLRTGPPPVVFTMGTAMQFAAGVFKYGVEACRQLRMRALLLTPYFSQVPEGLPSGIVHVPFAPFETLLPRCAALVHHGGIGTLAQGLASGIPQVVVPLNTDQPDNAVRVHKLGAGEILPLRKYNARTVAQKLLLLTGNTRLRERCAELATRLRGSTALSEAADLVESLTARNATTSPVQPNGVD